MLGNTAATTTAVLATKRLSRHARNAEILLVILPLLKQLLDHLPLLVTAAELRHIARVFDHGQGVEEGSETKESRKQDVQDGSRRVGSYDYRVRDPSRLDAIPKDSPGSTLKT